MPVHVVGLLDTTWQVDSIERERLSNLKTTLTLAEDEAILASVCGQRTFDWDFDSDSSYIGFGLVGTEGLSCSASAKAEEQRIVDALPSVTD